MKTEQLQGKWDEVRDKVKEEWGEFTDEDLDTIDGQPERLEGMIQERYGKTKEQAREDVETFCSKCDC